jgi:uncharacterized integral membrane protein
MLILILILISGSFLVYISKYNFALVNVNLGTFILKDIPLFYVMIGSVIFGLVLAYLVHLIISLSTAMTMRRKNKEIQKEKEEVLELTKRVHQLELENEKQKNGTEIIVPTDQNAL